MHYKYMIRRAIAILEASKVWPKCLTDFLSVECNGRNVRY